MLIINVNIHPMLIGISKLSLILYLFDSISVAIKPHKSPVNQCIPKAKKITSDDMKKAADPSSDLSKNLCLPNGIPIIAANESHILKQNNEIIAI